jgi:hypothetical protein
MKYLFAILLFLTASSVFAQWECRSRLSANLKPLYSGSDFNWAGELTGSVGYLNNSVLASGMVFAGVDYTHNNHQLFVEGGLKYWYSHNFDLDYNFSKSMVGLREVSYSYSAPTFELHAGLHQIDVADYFLVNERAWGASFKKSVGAFDLNFAAATVTKDFSRNGVFCTTGYLYDIVSIRNYSIGSSWGDTNFAALSFSKKRAAKKAPSTSSDDGFDEFESVVSSTKEKIELRSWGAIIYSEFGNYYIQPQFYGGLTGELKLGNVVTLNGEALFQQVDFNRAMIFYGQAEKEIEWKSGDISMFQLMFLGKRDIDDGAVAMLRFSNLFLGDVFRMDVIDMPLINVTVKHQFTNQQLSMKMQYTQQLLGDRMKELDGSVGKFFFNKRLRLTALAGIMKSDQLTNWSKLARLEMRIFF